jgi:hypothetical protein
MLTAEMRFWSNPPNERIAQAFAGGNRGNRNFTYPRNRRAARSGHFKCAVSKNFGVKKADFLIRHEYICFHRDFSVTAHIANQA